MMPAQEPVELAAEEEEAAVEPGAVRAEVAEYAIPIRPGVDITIEGRFPVSAKEWDRLMTVLEAMREGLVWP